MSFDSGWANLVSTAARLGSKSALVRLRNLGEETIVSDTKKDMPAELLKNGELEKIFGVEPENIKTTEPEFWSFDN